MKFHSKIANVTMALLICTGYTGSNAFASEFCSQLWALIQSASDDRFSEIRQKKIYIDEGFEAWSTNARLPGFGDCTVGLFDDDSSVLSCSSPAMKEELTKRIYRAVVGTVQNCLGKKWKKSSKTNSKSIAKLTFDLGATMFTAKDKNGNEYTVSAAKSKTSNSTEGTSIWKILVFVSLE